MKLFRIILISSFLQEIEFVYVFFWNDLLKQFRSETTCGFSRDFMNQKSFGGA